MMSAKKKADLTTILDDLRSEDAKKRLAAVTDIKEVAAALGPTKVRGELIPFLAEFLDDDENIVIELLTQLDSFTALLGGSDQEKCLVPLLISFCKTDEKKVGLKACAILQRILASNRELAGEAAKKLMKTEMNIAKECAALLIPGIVAAHESLEGQMLELYGSLLTGEAAQGRIICAKYLQELLKAARVKEEVGKLLDGVYGEGEELAKIHAIRALIDYYDVNPNSCLTKFKNLSVANSWRVNIKICDYVDAIAARYSKAHFKLIFEPALLKFTSSPQPQLRAASCKALAALAKNLSQQQQKSKLLGNVKKLAVDGVQFVKVQLSKSIVGLCGLVSSEVMNQWLLPIIFGFIKDANSEISLGVVRSFDYLSTRMNKDILEEKIVRPLLQQLLTDNWRIKCQIIDVLKSFITTPAFLNDSVLKTLFTLTDDRIDAVRCKINELIVLIINSNTKEWCDQLIMPKLTQMKENANYIKKQNLLDIIEKTSTNVSEKTVKEVYQNTIVAGLSDKVSNVRIKSMQVLRSNNKLSTAVAEKQFEKLKEDKDLEVREAIKKLRA